VLKDVILTYSITAKALAALKKEIAQEEKEEERLRPRTAHVDVAAAKSSPGEFMRVGMNLLARQYVHAHPMRVSDAERLC
jgi:hypothetical protein